MGKVQGGKIGDGRCCEEKKMRNEGRGEVRVEMGGDEKGGEVCAWNEEREDRGRQEMREGGSVWVGG